MSNKLCGKPPCKVGETVKFGTSAFKVLSLEPLYYEFRHYSASTALEDGFQNDVYAVSELIPPKDYIYWITGVGIEGKLEVQVKYQAGTPRNTVTAKSTQRLNRFQAPFTDPFTFRFALLNGDTIECDIYPDHAYTFGAIWFYGWKLYVKEIPTPDLFIQPKDVRRVTA